MKLTLVSLISVVAAAGFADGLRAYAEKRYAEAAVFFSQRAGAHARFNQGISEINAGRAREGLVQLRKALDTPDPEIRRRTHYNIALLYHLNARAAGKPDTARSSYEIALENYRLALAAVYDEKVAFNFECATLEFEKIAPPPPKNETQKNANGNSANREKPAASPRPPAPPRKNTEQKRSEVELYIEGLKRQAFSEHLKTLREAAPSSENTARKSW